MSLLYKEIEELRRLKDDFVQGKVSQEKLYGQLAIFSQVEKRTKQILQAHISSAKFGKSFFDRMVNANLIDDGHCIDVTDIRKEKIKCPDQKKQITRDQCLDFSGDEKNYEKCSSCGFFRSTRKLLLGD